MGDQDSFSFEAAAAAPRGSGGAAKAPGKGRKKAGRRKQAGSAAPARKTTRKKGGAAGGKKSAADLARGQRDISVSEFFAKNQHLLGFDNPSKALLTTVKEGVDNALDACEEAGIVPEILVEIDQLSETRFRIAICDNGPGIVRAQVPKIFGRLLYGSKFHRLRQSRGQQGIGISAAGMYGLLTTGKPISIVTRTGATQAAHHFELVIDTKTNQPRVKRDEEVEWDSDHGTRVEIELEGAYRGGQHSVDAYIRQISLANPHARLDFLPPKSTDGSREIVSFPRVSEELPPETSEIKPHPYGVELGVLMQMFRDTTARNLRGSLINDFSRVPGRIADEICKVAKVSNTRRSKDMSREESERVHKAISQVKIMSPPTDCIAPIGETLIEQALRAEVDADFYASVTRKPNVYRGNPFAIEVGLAYGGKLSADDSVTVFRFANRVPLQYQQGACAMTKAVSATDWKSYKIQQPRGAPPFGPMVLMIHIASVWVPFTSESKEAIAHYPEIIKEMKLGLQECGRKVATHIRKKRRAEDEAKKRAYIEKYIPQVAVGLQVILGLSEKQRDGVVTDLTDILERSRKN